jgi:Uma2 family endonuclease
MDFDLFLKANEIGIKLELTAGMTSWEMMPVLLHQESVDRIRNSIQRLDEKTECQCLHYSDVYVTFPDGSLKRPDISIFCRRPTETTSAITLLPEAVIEIISEGYEAKDLEINPSFYLSQGIKDVIVHDPQTGFVFHARKDRRKRYTSPQTFRLECGCEVIV